MQHEKKVLASAVFFGTRRFDQRAHGAARGALNLVKCALLYAMIMCTYEKGILL